VRLGTAVSHWLLLAGTMLLIVAVVLPREFQNHTHWAKVRWIPFVTPPVRTRDLAANVMLYLPFGFAASRLPGRRKGARTILLAAGLSLVTEWTQVFSHDRIPSTTDVCCNMLGAGLGGWAYKSLCLPGRLLADKRL
jgi:glycopeptide antibiotics resistance protein